MHVCLFSFCTVFFIVFALAQDEYIPWMATPFNPPSFPLAVKTPYVNAWDPQGNESAPISSSYPKIGSTFFSVSSLLCLQSESSQNDDSYHSQWAGIP